MTEPRILIVGGGILGAAAARRLSLIMTAVTLVDPMVEDQRTSVGSLAWLNVSSTADPDYARLRLASLRLWQRLGEAHPDCPVRFPGSLLFGANADAIRAHSELMCGLGWRTRVLDASELTKSVPGMANTPGTALLASQEGAAYPDRITAWMLDQARASGLNVIRGRVRAFRTKGDRVCGAELRDGERIEADLIIVAAGNGSRSLLADLGVDLPLRGSPGILMRTSQTQYRIPYVMATPQLDFWQEDSGAILMSSSLSKTSHRADSLIAEDALSVLTDLFPDISDVEVAQIIRRNRPIPADGFPLVGAVGPDGLWVAAMHSGMTLAPIIAEVLADQILGRPDRYGMAAYRPDRNINGNQERAVL